MSQEEVVEALEDPGFYPHRPARVEHVQTHISHVFLAGPYVYKLKKAVRFSSLDFSTFELRRHFCEEEVRLNRRLSPSVYLGVVPITHEPDGILRLAGRGDAVDHVVWMRRLPADRMLVNLVRAGAASLAMTDALAGRLATFHRAASEGPEVSVYADPERLAARWARTRRARPRGLRCGALHGRGPCSHVRGARRRGRASARGGPGRDRRRDVHPPAPTATASPGQRVGSAGRASSSPAEPTNRWSGRGWQPARKGDRSSTPDGRRTWLNAPGAIRSEWTNAIWSSTRGPTSVLHQALFPAASQSDFRSVGSWLSTSPASPSLPVRLPRAR